MKRNRVIVVLVIVTLCAVLAGTAGAQANKPNAPAATVGSGFTYQGRLNDGGTPANGAYDFQFKLFDAASAGTQLGVTVAKDDASVSNGLFVVNLDFGAGAFNGQALYLEIGVRAGSSTGAYTTLSPRQPLTPAPYALAFGAPGSMYGYLVQSASPGPYPTLGLNTYSTSYLAGLTGYGGILQFQNGDGKLVYYTGSNVAAGSPHTNTARVGIDSSGHVGIGTTDPLTLLHLKGSTASSGNNTAVIENPAIGPYASAIHYGTSGDWYIRSAAASGKVVIQDTGGNVGIGDNNPLAKLSVRGSDNSSSNEALSVTGADVLGLRVYNDGTVQLGNLGTSNLTTFHLCSVLFGPVVLCNGAAQYVPTIDDGAGYAQATDLVSIAPALKNPYGDAHSSFVVKKSTTACDDRLLGVIGGPESSADGEKKNDHYLPLALSGNFPVKVTMENGAIKRGDPITSSSKPGYGMKATSACKIVGYALEDANAEGTIQVFAHLSENASSEVAALREQVKQLKEQNAAFEARLTALENRVQSGGKP